VFANREIDEMLTGSWAAVQVSLGVKQASDFSPEDLKPKMPLNLLQLQKTLFELVERQMSIAPVRPVAKGFGGGNKKQKVKNKKKNS
jgi:predicted component of type VI protein secretion system